MQDGTLGCDGMFNYQCVARKFEEISCLKELSSEIYIIVKKQTRPLFFSEIIKVLHFVFSAKLTMKTG